jgi:hypothetical protein
LSVWVRVLPLFGQRFAWWSWFWILMGRALLLRVRELASSCGNFLGRIGDCSGSLESVGRLSDLGLRDESWLGGVCLGFFFLGCSAYIRHLCYVVLFYWSLFILCRDLVNNIFSISKKKYNLVINNCWFSIKSCYF